MTDNKNYLPHKLYIFLLTLAHEKGLAIKEVETIFLRDKAKEFGFRCEHKNIRYSAKHNQPYCADCWTRMREVQPRVFRGNVVVREAKCEPLETFIDEDKKLV
jgi:hypothetical protein